VEINKNRIKLLQHQNDCGNFIDGKFFYYPTYFEVEGFKAEVEGMDNDDLVQEIYESSDINTDISEIIYDYMIYGKLSSVDRDKLIWYYVLANCEAIQVTEYGEY